MHHTLLVRDGASLSEIKQMCNGSNSSLKKTLMKENEGFEAKSLTKWRQTRRIFVL